MSGAHGSVEFRGRRAMSGMEIRALECFLALSEEVHFGRAAERLYVSQSRVSQLLRALEGRIGARLLDRTSRRVRLTPLGERFLAELRPAYDALSGAVEGGKGAARGLTGGPRGRFPGARRAVSRASGASVSKGPPTSG